MLLANKITIGRFVLVPAIVGAILLHASAVRAGSPDQTYRWLAFGLFALAALSDLLDGYVARHYRQQSRLGAFMDPLADKFLMVSTILTLSLTPWPWTFPLWFPVLVISRDILAIAGTFLVNHLAGSVRMEAHWAGKGATFFQIVAVCWVMLGIRVVHPVWPMTLACVFILAAAGVYVRAAVAQVMEAGPTGPEEGKS